MMFSPLIVIFMAGFFTPIREGGKIDPQARVHGSHVAGDGAEDSMPVRGVIADT